ncbi:MAG: DUF4400 domain-containing protein [Thermodesulfobacteriota bacterium]
MAANAKPRKPLWQWLLTVISMEIAIAFFMVPGATLENLHVQEMKMMEAQLGEEASQQLQALAEKWFQKAFVDTGAVAASENYFEKNNNHRDPFDDRGFGAWMQKRTGVLWLAVRYGIYRWGMLVLWLPLIFAAVVPVSLDAAARRNIHKYEFSYASPLKHKNSLRALNIVILLVLFMPLMPVALPPLTIPAGMLMGMAAWWVFWANMQKRL